MADEIEMETWSPDMLRAAVEIKRHEIEYKPYVAANGNRFTVEQAKIITEQLRFDPYPEGYWENGEGSNYHGYGDDAGWHQTARVMHDHVGDGIKILELGCASGYFVQAAKVHFDHVQGIDLSSYAVGKPAPGASGDITVGTATDLSQFRGRPDSPELICSWEMLEHLTEAEILTCLTEIMHTLPENGEMWHRIALDTTGDREFAGIPDHHPHDDHTHVTIRSKAWWRDLIAGSFWEIDGDAYAWQWLPSEENALSREFRGRDWENRFFVYRKVKLVRPEEFLQNNQGMKG
ncbi:methyltransferase [Arthrobacter phage KellEzio]|uniref:Methyltransferase n=1 Tax=Arthrobacter phage KellEzio TaxID=1796995 RepID=A0A140G6I2_9CAUD|nr:methyltransferase [Arthrobacter phage KellEzio]AMM44267.1 methyltransferase [Arthrobacter phage KellEzio]